MITPIRNQTELNFNDLTDQNDFNKKIDQLLILLLVEYFSQTKELGDYLKVYELNDPTH